MRQAEKYRELAARCVQAARDASNDTDKLLLLEMADRWMKMADQPATEAGEDTKD
jgi:hypothetical protein